MTMPVSINPKKAIKIAKIRQPETNAELLKEREGQAGENKMTTTPFAV